MKLVDSHAHLDFGQFHEDFDDTLARATDAGVEKIINIGADMGRSRASIALADNYPNIFATVGVHPDEANEVNFETIHDDLLTLAKNSENVVGIGETGLDFFQSAEKKKQKELFQIHIDVAKHVSLPLIIHIRNGEDEEAVNTAYEILKKSDYQIGVIHCFTRGPDWAKRFLDLGLYIGYTGIITYKNAEEIREAVASTDLGKILIETDCPFLAPQKYRGQRNEPAYVVEVAQKIAEIKGITLDKVAKQTTINVEKLFNI